MKIPEQKVKELQRLYKERYGKDISYEEAQTLGDSLVRIIRLVYDPSYEKDYN